MDEECVLNHNHHHAISILARSKYAFKQTRIYRVDRLL
jgi:hypothetical protein